MVESNRRGNLNCFVAVLKSPSPTHWCILTRCPHGAITHRLKEPHLLRVWVRAWGLNTMLQAPFPTTHTQCLHTCPLFQPQYVWAFCWVPASINLPTDWGLPKSTVSSPLEHFGPSTSSFSYHCIQIVSQFIIHLAVLISLSIHSFCHFIFGGVYQQRDG